MYKKEEMIHYAKKYIELFNECHSLPMDKLEDFGLFKKVEMKIEKSPADNISIFYENDNGIEKELIISSSIFNKLKHEHEDRIITESIYLDDINENLLNFEADFKDWINGKEHIEKFADSINITYGYNELRYPYSKPIIRIGDDSLLISAFLPGTKRYVIKCFYTYMQEFKNWLLEDVCEINIYEYSNVIVEETMLNILCNNLNIKIKQYESKYGILIKDIFKGFMGLLPYIMVVPISLKNRVRNINKKELLGGN